MSNRFLRPVAHMIRTLHNIAHRYLACNHTFVLLAIYYRSSSAVGAAIDCEGAKISTGPKMRLTCVFSPQPGAVATDDQKDCRLESMKTRVHAHIANKHDVRQSPAVCRPCRSSAMQIAGDRRLAVGQEVTILHHLPFFSSSLGRSLSTTESEWT
jgi:hypothetical protein